MMMALKLRYPVDLASVWFRFGLEEFRLSSHTEELCYNETDCLWITYEDEKKWYEK